MGSRWSVYTYQLIVAAAAATVHTRRQDERFVTHSISFFPLFSCHIVSQWGAASMVIDIKFILHYCHIDVWPPSLFDSVMMMRFISWSDASASIRLTKSTSACWRLSSVDPARRSLICCGVVHLMSPAETCIVLS